VVSEARIRAPDWFKSMHHVRNKKKYRNPWLDCLRAGAIFSVMVHHISQGWPVARPWLVKYTNYGSEGVDLFFVLSGWLIGGLFWKELVFTGKVRVVRFWLRRWLRTIPPYLGGLFFAWVAVWIYRKEPLDLGYFLFIQNYYEQFPFFYVSWSLCIEEHFYLFTPLLFVFMAKIRWLLLTCLPVLPAVFRYIEYVPEITGFGYHLTATHLYADGLMIGFSMAYLQVNYRKLVVQLAPYAAWGVLATAILIYLDFGKKAEFVFNPLLLALLFTCLLIALVNRSWVEKFSIAPAEWLAKISYSVYLVHALVIHGFVRLVSPSPGWMEIPALILEVAIILFAGWIFYMVFEKTAFRIRHRLVPSTG